MAVPAGGDPEALGYYQVASIDEAVSNYIATHLALTDDGLYILMDESGYKLKLTNDGAFIVDPSGATVATYSAQTVLGNLNGLNYLTLSHNGLSLTVDGGATNIFDVRLAGSSSSYTKSFSQTYSQYGSYGNLGLNRNMSDGTLALVINMRNSLDSGNVYTETYNFTVGTPSTVSAFKYEDATYGHQEITIQFTGADIILIDAYNQPNATLSLWGTATFPVTTNRTTYMTFGTRASSAVNGQYSVAEGYGVEASGAYSHAQNYNTVAAYDDQTALGKFNDNQSNTAVEIGNGTSNAARSNALTVDWYGNVETAGGIETGDEAIIAEGLSVYEVGQGNFFVVRPDQNKVLLAVDDTAAAGTTDGDLYAAITALGWESEVIV